MDLSTFIVAVFCLTDDRLKGNKLRQRGPFPELCDAEVLTIEVVGEFLGIDTEKGLYKHSRCHYGEWFPALKRVHRTTFCSACSDRMPTTYRASSSEYILLMRLTRIGGRKVTPSRSYSWEHEW